MSRHKPVTPLPLRLEKAADQLLIIGADNAVSCVFGDLSDDRSVGIFGDPEGCSIDAKYFIHTGNYYHKLVKALRNLQETVRDYRDTGKPNYHAMAMADDEADALLREIGEELP